VLPSGDQKCKLSGFASAEAVRAREKWEEDNKVRKHLSSLFMYIKYRNLIVNIRILILHENSFSCTKFTVYVICDIMPL
jgi:hypothetical protein